MDERAWAIYWRSVPGCPEWRLGAWGFSQSTYLEWHAAHVWAGFEIRTIAFDYAGHAPNDLLEVN